jgi:hypothetical protein
MERCYIQFEAPPGLRGSKTEGRVMQTLKKVAESIFSKIVPEANPDFEKKIDEVKIWLIECDNNGGLPQREIGIDKDGQVIIKMPFKNNWGYWTDNNLVLEDFRQRFQTNEISQDFFETKWLLLG